MDAGGGGTGASLDRGGGAAGLGKITRNTSIDDAYILPREIKRNLLIGKF